MSSMTTTRTWSPSSFQLKLAFNCRCKSPPLLLRMRFRELDRRTRIFSIIGDSVRDSSSGIERRRSSWVGANQATDSFSGWSPDDGNDNDSTNGNVGQNSSNGKQSLVGVVGAGVAGVVLVAGLTFAALSIGKRSTSRVEKQMEPLTDHQETSLTSDEHNERQEENNDPLKNKTQENGAQDGKGIDSDPSTYTESNQGTATELHDNPDLEHTSKDGGVINDASIQQDLLNELAIDGATVTPEARSGPPESDIVDDSSAVSGIEQKDDIPDTERIDTTKESIEENLFVIGPIAVDANTGNISNGSLDEASISRKAENPNSSSIDSLPTGPLTSNIQVDLQVESILEPEPNDNVESITSLPTNVLDLSNLPEILVEKVDSLPLVHNIDKGTSSHTNIPSAVDYQLANEKMEREQTETNGSRSSFVSNHHDLLTSAGIPAPTALSAALQAPPGKILVPAVVDQVQGQALAALQVLKVIEADVQPGDLCTRREYARWLVSASSALARNTLSKVYPAMYIENVTELAFDDITPEDPDFASIQGLAEAGLISSKLSRHDLQLSSDQDPSSLCFCPESPLSRQDLVSWKMALERRQLPVADRKTLQQTSGFIDIDKINPDAWPALVADLVTGEQGIIALSFGYTRLFQPDKPVTKAQAAIALATGEASDIVSEELARIEAESMAEKAVAAHTALVAEVEKDVNANFEKELLMEREKIDAVEKLAEAAKQELERLRAQREEENLALMKERASLDSEMEILSRLRRDVEEQLQSLMSDKVEISYEKERVSKLRKEAETENQEIARLQHELEVERKALSMARAWAEDEAKRAREQAKALEEARDRWESRGLKVVVGDDLREEANAGVTWLNAGKQFSTEGTVNRAENLVDKLKGMAHVVRGKSRDTINTIIQKILQVISLLKGWAAKTARQAGELKDTTVSKLNSSLQEVHQSSTELTSAVRGGIKRIAEDCREGVGKIGQKFKT